MAEIIQPTREQVERYIYEGIMTVPLTGYSLEDLYGGFVDLGMVESLAAKQLSIRSKAELVDYMKFATPAYAWIRGNVDSGGCEPAKIYVASLRLGENNISPHRNLIELALTKKIDGLKMHISDRNPKDHSFQWNVEPVYS